MSAVAVPRPALGAVLAPVDRALGRVTMYRLVLLLLAALALVALAYAAAGTLPYAPGDMAASVAVAVAVAYGANRLVAPLFRVRPHAESALITGLLLFFLFWPSAKPGDLLDVGLAALLATLSKYLLAWRGRHLLNPAAAGAAIVGVTQLGATVWWVGGKELLPFVLVAAVLVLYRTRRLAVGGLFVLVALAIVTVRLVDGGQGVGDAVTTALQSYPIVFLAGFMLSEPLTLPPRRGQALLVAALVGVLFAIPWHVGGVTSTPELALVLGNLLAFALARTGVRLRFLERRPLGPSTAEYLFAAERPVRFAAGQYAELALPHGRADRRGVRRVFTIASAPGDGRTIAFGVRESPTDGRGSTFKRTLAALPSGTVVSATNVAGDFVLPRDRAVPLLLVAGGIGITPFVSQLRDEAVGEGPARDVVLVVGLTPGEGVPYRAELERSAARVVLVGTDPVDGLPAGWTQIAAPLLDEDALRRAAPDAAGRTAYVSGPPAMVDAVRAALRRIGVRRVRTDHFAGY